MKFSLKIPNTRSRKHKQKIHKLKLKKKIASFERENDFFLI